MCPPLREVAAHFSRDVTFQHQKLGEAFLPLPRFKRAEGTPSGVTGVRRSVQESQATCFSSLGRRPSPSCRRMFSEATASAERGPRLAGISSGTGPTSTPARAPRGAGLNGLATHGRFADGAC